MALEKQKWVLTREPKYTHGKESPVSRPGPTPDDIVIAVMGPKGSGKTTFISLFNPLLPVDINGWVWRNDKIYECFDGAIGKFYLVDNRGYDYSSGHDIHISKELARLLHIRQITLTGLVFLYSILDPRSPEGAKLNLDTADLLVGELPSSQTVLATTFWDRVGEDIGMTHQKRLQTSVRLMTKTSGQVFRQDKGRESARAIIEYLVQNRTTAGRSVNRFLEGKSLSKTDTDGGNNAKPTPKSYQDKMNLPASQAGQESNTKFLEGKAQPDQRLANRAGNLNNDIEANIGTDGTFSGYWTLDPATAPKMSFGDSQLLSHAEIDTNAPYQPFHSDRGVNLFVTPANITPSDSRIPTASAIFHSSETTISADKWVFGNDLPATKLNLRPSTEWSSQAERKRKRRSQKVWDERTEKDQIAKAEEPRMGEFIRKEMEELNMRQESTSMQFYPPTDSSPRDLGYFLWKLRNFTRPRLAQGFRRIEWLCDCGEIQYGDFDNTDPDAVSLLEASLQGPTGDASSPGAQAASTALQTPAAVHLGTSSTQRPAPVAPSPGHIPVPATQTSTQPTPPVITQPRYLELCINHGKFERRLGEVDVSNINSDGQLFRQIKETYDTVRGYRSKWFLLEPTSIQFVEFGLEERHRVIIYPSEGSWPPPSAVAAGEWEYECPPRPPPPIPAHHFLHLMHDPRPHPRTIWMRRLPKKLLKSMMSEPGDIPTGWGVYIVEGLNQRVVAQIFLYFTVAVVIVSIFWSLWKRDLQGGMGIGSFALAGAVLLGFALQVEFYGQLADFAR